MDTGHRLRKTWTVGFVLLLVWSSSPPSNAQAFSPTQSVSHVSLPGGSREQLNQTIWYDTNHFSNQWTWHLPEGFTVTGATDDFGVVRFSQIGTQVSITTHYRGGQGYRSFQVFAHRETATQIAPGLYFATVSAAFFEAGSEGSVILDAPASGLILAVNGTQWSRFVETRQEPFGVTFVFASSQVAEAYAFKQGDRYSFLFPKKWNSETYERLATVARDAEGMIPQMESVTGLPAPYEGKFLVILAPDTLFDWEGGFFLNGLIALRATQFEKPESAWRLEQGRALVHETLHAFLQQPLLWTRGHAGWANEGSARYMEYLFEQNHPDLLSKCEPGLFCVNLSVKMDLDELRLFYSKGEPFRLDWSPDRVTDAQRAFGYAFSGYLIAAYVQQFGLPAYRSFVGNLHRHAYSATCDDTCVGRLLLADMLQPIGRADERAVLLPYASLHASDSLSFEQTVAPLVVAARQWPPPPGPVFSPQPTEAWRPPLGNAGEESGRPEPAPSDPGDLPRSLAAFGAALLVVLFAAGRKR